MLKVAEVGNIYNLAIYDGIFFGCVHFNIL